MIGRLAGCSVTGAPPAGLEDSTCTVCRCTTWSVASLRGLYRHPSALNEPRGPQG